MIPARLASTARADKLRDLAYRCGTVEQDLRHLANGFTAEADLKETADYLNEIVSELSDLVAAEVSE